MDPTPAPEPDDARVSAILLDGKPASDDVQLKREVLLAKLFPAQVTRPKLGRYDVLEFVGEGGMGTVFAAYDPRLDRRVAVKLLRQSGDEQQRRARLLREAKALARLSHLNIVTIHEVWEEQGEVYLAMEFVQGQSLFDWQAAAPAWREVVDIYRQAGEGLVAAHEAGLVYRDFKPHNAILRDDGVVKLLDFGLARLEDAPPQADGELDTGSTLPPSDDRLTRPGAVMGTPAYMAPEQREGRPADAASDQFSFCVSLWEALHGSLPSMREPGAEPGTESNRERTVPTWVRQVVERGLSGAPADRYPSMRALLRELGRDPAARRRRVLAVATGVALTVGGGLAIAELRAAPSNTCVVVDSPWSATQRDAARAGVMQAGGDASAQTWSLLEPRLDRYASALDQLRRTTCESHRRGLLPETHYDLQVACLDRREAGFEELRDLLGRAEPSAVSNANKAISQLPAPTQCADTQALRAEHPPPSDPQVAAQVAALREELARAQAEESAGLYPAAETRAAEVLAQARSLDYPPLQAEAMMRSGSAGMQALSPDAADRLDEALWLAIATEQRRVAAEAAAKRVFALVELRDRTTDASEAIALARSLAERPGAADWPVRWALANNTAIAAERDGDPGLALRSYEAALLQVPEGDHEGSFERAVTLLNMAPVQVRAGQGPQGERSARSAIDELTALLGSEHPQLHTAQASLALVLRSMGRYAEAQTVLWAVLERVDQNDPPPLWMLYDAAQIAWGRADVEAVRMWCARARPQLSQGEGPPSLWTLMFTTMEARVAVAGGELSSLDALQALASRVERPLRVSFALERAEVLLLAGRAQQVADVLGPVAEEPELSQATRRYIQMLVGLALVEQGHHDDARARLLEVVEADDADRQLDPAELARALQGLATAEAGLGRSPEAIRWADRTLSVLEGFDPGSRAMHDARATRAAIASDDPAALP